MGERKGMKKNIVRFISEVDNSLRQIRNESVDDAAEECKDETAKLLADLWLKA